MMSAPVRILAVAALCILALIGLVVRESMARASGAEVQMAMAGVDPRSVLSGNYVTISLRENLPPSQKCPPTTSANDWLSLRPSGQLYHVAQAARSQAEAQAAGAIAVRGTFTCYDATNNEAPIGGAPGGVIDVAPAPSNMTADLGIQRFYVNQADAERIGALLRHARDDEASPVNAILSIGQDGRARLKGIAVNGQRFELSWL